MDEAVAAKGVSDGTTGGAGWPPSLFSDQRGFTLIELLIVVVIVGVLAAIAIPAYVGQQDKAKDTAAQAQLRAAATAQQLYYAQEDEYADDAGALIAHGFRQGGQVVDVVSGGGNAYCMEAEGGDNKKFSITHNVGKPEGKGCGS